MGKQEPNLDHLLQDLRILIASFLAQNKGFDIHLVCENGVVRTKVHHQGETYDVSGKLPPTINRN